MALNLKGYETLLPLYKAKRRWSDRVKLIDLPLFPGYLFCQFDSQYQLPIIKTPGVFSIISFVNAPAPIEEHDLESIQALMASGVDVEPCPYLRSGQTSRIDDGPVQKV